MSHFKILDAWAEAWRALQSEPNANPMVNKKGAGPEGAKCRDCVYMSREFHKYLKCKLRGVTRSTATDHRAKWDACRLFVERGTL